MWRIKLLGFLLLHMAVVLSGQEVVIRVVDDSDGRPVPFCHICLEDRETGKKEYCVGDINGEARIALGGKSLLSVTAIGYRNYLEEQVPKPMEGTGSGEVSDAEDASDAGESMIIRLKPSHFDLDEVVVTGQYKPVRVDRSIYDIKFIGKPRIENQAANTMAELLDKELTFRINNDPSTGSSLNLQGISGENVKILVDGVPVIGRLDGNIDLSQINLHNVDHIEIVEGPMSVIYGSNALAGVVNIITRKNQYAKFRSHIHGYNESVGIYNLNGGVETRSGNHDLSVNGGRNFFGGYALVDTARRKDWKPKEQYNASLGYNYSANGVSLRYKVDGFRERLLDRNNPFPPYYEKGNDTWFTTTRFNNSLQMDWKLREAGDLRMLAAWSYYDRQKVRYLKDLTTLESVLVTNPAEHDTSMFHALVARGGYNHAPEEGSLGFQAGFDINSEYGKGKRMKNGEEYIGDYALFASVQWQPVEELTFQPAIRISYNTRYRSPVTPSVNIRYRPGKSTLRASYARGFRAPSLKELYLNFYDSNHQIEGNEDLTAERSHHFNLAVSRKTGIASRPLEIKAKAYYNLISERISLVQVDPENPLYYKNANTDRFESLGGDLSIRLQPHKNLSLDAGISYIGRKDSYYRTQEFVFAASSVTSMTLNLVQNVLSVSAFHKYSGKYPVHTFISDEEIALNYLDAYHNLDINLSVKLFRQQLRLSSGVKNLFDNTRLVGIDGGTGHGGGDGISSLVGWGRTFFMGINYQFSKF